MKLEKDIETTTVEQSISLNATLSRPMCWITPIGEPDNNYDDISPIPCNPSLKMGTRQKVGYSFRGVPGVSRGTILSDDEFRIVWRADYESFVDESGNELRLDQDSFMSRIILCQAHIISSCNAFTPNEWSKSSATFPTNVDGIDDFMGEDFLSTKSDIPYIKSNFKHNHLKRKTVNGSVVSYFDEILKLSVPTAGVYSLAMHTAFNLTDMSGATTGTAGSILRVDSSINLKSGFLIYTDPIEIKSILPVSIYISTFFCAFVILFLLFVLAALIRYRKSNIMKISQVSFLYAFVILGIFSSSTFLYPNYDDYHCQFIKLNVVALSTMYAIIIGRLWRISYLLSPLLPSTSSSKKTDSVRSSPLMFRFFEFVSDWNACFNWLKHCGKREIKHRNSIRRSVPSYILVRLIFLISIPPFVCQIYGMITFASMEVDYDENHTTARYMCIGPLEISTVVALSYYFFLQFITVVVAYLTNGLPDQINETCNVLTASWTTFTFNISLGIVVSTLSPSRSTAPDLNYLMRMFSVNATTLNLTWQIIMPKIKLARSGDDSNLQHLLVDRRSSWTVPYDNKTISPHLTRCRPSAYFSDLNNPLGKSKVRAKDPKRCHSWHVMGYDKSELERKTGFFAPTSRRTNRAANDIKENIDKALDEISPDVLFDCDSDSDCSLNQKENRRNSFVISQSRLPPSRLMSQILSTLDILWKICSQVSTEKIPPTHDWHIFQARITDLSNQCKKTRFDWDERCSEELEESQQLQLAQISSDEEASRFPSINSEKDGDTSKKHVVVQIEEKFANDIVSEGKSN